MQQKIGQPTSTDADTRHPLLPPPGKVTLLHNVSWQELEAILEELGDNRAARLSYDRGTLEIMTPDRPHEEAKVFISDFVKVLAREANIPYRSLGSTTLRRRDRSTVAEADDCFYFQNLELISKQPDLDLERGDPPPDLAVESDITSKTKNKLEKYTQLEVPEVWRYDRGVLHIYQLSKGKHVEPDTSLAFPWFPVREIPQFMKQHQTTPDAAVIEHNFRDWARAEYAEHDPERQRREQSRQQNRQLYLDYARAALSGSLDISRIDYTELSRRAIAHPDVAETLDNDVARRAAADGLDPKKVSSILMQGPNVQRMFETEGPEEATGYVAETVAKAFREG